MCYVYVMHQQTMFGCVPSVPVLYMQMYIEGGVLGNCSNGCQCAGLVVRLNVHCEARSVLSEQSSRRVCIQHVCLMRLSQQ